MARPLTRSGQASATAIGTLYRVAIGIELAVVAFALLRPRFGWALLVLQYLAFLGVLGVLIGQGVESCGCMGSTVSIAPGGMAI